MNKEGSDTLDPLAKNVQHVPKPIPSLFSTPYIECERERDERDERRPLKECPNRLDPLTKVVQHVPKPIPSLFWLRTLSVSMTVMSVMSVDPSRSA